MQCAAYSPNRISLLICISRWKKTGQSDNKDRILGCSLDSTEELGEGRMIAKLFATMNNTDHAVQDTLSTLSSTLGDRLLHL